MRLLSPRVFSLFVFPILLLSYHAPAKASDDYGEDRTVTITLIKGDVRLSRGDGRHPDLNKPWEQAVRGELIKEGYALSTGDGRAEIEFENGSTIYLAPNSLLIFRELAVLALGEADFQGDLIEQLVAISPVLIKQLPPQGFRTTSGTADPGTTPAFFLRPNDNDISSFVESLFSPGDCVVSRIALASGTATFWLQPGRSEYFYIETPTDNTEVRAPDTFFARVDAYLDATGITPQGEKGERVIRPGVPKLQVTKGQTLYFQAGEIIELPDPDRTSFFANPGRFISAGLEEIENRTAPLRKSGLSVILPGGPVLETLPIIRKVQAGIVSSARRADLQSAASDSSQVASDWDAWVDTHVQQKSSLMASALKASGLSSPVPGLIDLYKQGSFFDCEPYGRCWEPTELGAEQGNPTQSPAPNAQSTSATQANAPFPQTVEWHELVDQWCAPPVSRTVRRVAHTPEELQQLLQMKEVAEHAPRTIGRYSVVCDNGYWIHRRGHYAKVLTRRPPAKCSGKKCQPVRAPRPSWVRVGHKTGFVPPHPGDVKGKPPVNLKNGIIVPPSKPGQPVEHISWDPSQKVKVLDKVPSEFQREPGSRILQVSAPEIRAHLLQESLRGKFSGLPGQQSSRIAYDYKSHHFLMASSPGAGTKSKEVAVGGIDSHGKVASFADGRSGRYADSFARSEAASTYRGGSFNQAHGSGSSSFGGGHGSGSGSGSYSAGSHSSGSSSSGGFSGHSSGGSVGGGSVSSASSGASSSASSGGGGHGRP